MSIELPDQVAYLERLGFGVEVDGGDLAVEVPPDRHFDVTREVDLIEEVARVHGLDEKLPSTLPAVGGQAGGLSRAQRLRRRAEDTMRDLGFDEVVGWSFTDPEEVTRLRIEAEDPRAAGIVISNPLSEEQSVMRTTLLGSLLDVARRNAVHGAERIALFESGRVYLDSASTGQERPNGGRERPIGGLGGDFPGDQAPPAREPHRLGCLAIGSLTPASWRGGGEPVDFFALKGVLVALGERLGVEPSFEAAAEPFLHPGRAARVSVGGEIAGWIGELHPLVGREWDLDAAAGFEVELAPLLAVARAGEETFEDVTTYPAVRQDLAVVVPEDVPAAQVRAAVVAGGGDLLRDAIIFDLYEGEQVGEDRKSLALRLEFRAADRTLTDEEVAGLRDSIVAELAEIGGSLRE